MEQRYGGGLRQVRRPLNLRAGQWEGVGIF